MGNSYPGPRFVVFRPSVGQKGKEQQFVRESAPSGIFFPERAHDALDSKVMTGRLGVCLEFVK
jgi:hypothetical protein